MKDQAYLTSLDADNPIRHSIDWSKCHNGVMLCSFEKTVEIMPEVAPILEELKPQLELPLKEYVVDVKVHMLMPKQFPCIPNWHRDFVPRDMNMKRDFKNLTKLKMYAWMSASPTTEFMREDKTTFFVEAQHWHEFTQHDLHRGTMSKEHVWRGFIRVIPKSFIHPTTINVGQLRRHTQVYLDAEKFNW